MLDNYTEIEPAPHTTSAEEYRGVMSTVQQARSSAESSFTVRSRRHISLTITSCSRQSSGPPDLSEIDNDDVVDPRSTVGQLDEGAALREAEVKR